VLEDEPTGERERMSRVFGVDSADPSPSVPPARPPTLSPPPSPPDGFVAVANPLRRWWPDSRAHGPFHVLAITVMLVTAAAAGVLMVVAGGGTASACGAARCSTTGPDFTSASADIQPGGVAAATASGSISSFFSPAPVSDRSAPAHVVLSGPDAPDPFVLVDGSHEYMYTSNGTLKMNVPTYTLLADHRFGDLRDALPRLPGWARRGFTWAPDVRRVVGGWALYFTAAVKDASPSMQCIGDAFGSSPLGPFEAEPKPFICQVAHRGSIDPRTFVDAQGTLWLYWKSDDNANPQIPWKTGKGLTGIYVQRLSASGRTLLGTPRLVVQPSSPWEGTIIEAPDMILVQGRYWMFYSGGWFNSPRYAIGAALCAGPVGPCTPTSVQPLLSSNSQGAGPGEPSVFEDSSGIWMLYNPWASNDPGPTPNRPVVEVRLGFSPAGPYIANS
jgi:hypothetical protein